MATNYIYINPTSLSNTSSNQKWYAIRCLSGKEIAVFTGLVNKMKSQQIADISTLVLPTENVSMLRRGKKVVVSKPIYSGYLFVKTNLSNTVINTINTRIVSPTGLELYCRFLVIGNNKTIQPISVQEAISIEHYLAQPPGSVNSPSLFKVGESIMFNSGELKNVHGVISSMDKHTATISVSIFNRKTPIKVGLEHLRKV
jgi:transcription termination/antitermination protein NusG